MEQDLFWEVLCKMKDGLTITFTKDNVAEGDTFLIFGCGYNSHKITFRQPGDLWWVCFENDEPILLENCPKSFLRSILKNI